MAIDEASIRSLEPYFGRWPWPRLVHASLVNYLARGPAKAIVYDVIFGERDKKAFKVGDEAYTGEESDKAFAESVRRAGNVVMVADVVSEGDGRRARPRPRCSPPSRQAAASNSDPRSRRPSRSWRGQAARSGTTC